MNRKEFRDLLRRYLNDDCTTEERRLVDQLYDLIGAETTVNWDDTEGVEEKMWAKIEAQTIGKQTVETPIVALKQINASPFLRWQWRAAAAILIGILAAAGFLGVKYKNVLPLINTSESAMSQRNIVNHNIDPMEIALEDGSKIILKSGAQLRVPEHFDNNKREVFLTGEAFFDIAKNPERPFFVHAKNVVTRVLGTSFWVKNTEGSKNIAVEVVSGKVTVYKEKTTNKENKENDGVVLTPNLKVTYFIEDEHFVTGLVEKPVLVNKTENQNKTPNFIFSETALSDVIGQLEAAYGIQIVLANDALNTCPLTANLQKQPLYTKLDLICATLNATYEIKGTNILISGKGCE
ncbi:MAG: FecR family protein [Saprospiraceae bacterium]|nr:FecR family protein [Saprospiraceae bacterium]